MDPATIASLVGLAASLFGGGKNRNNTNQINSLNVIDQLMQFFQQGGSELTGQGQGALNTLINSGGLTSPQNDILGQLRQFGSGAQGRVDQATDIRNLQLPAALQEMFALGGEISSNRGNNANLQFLEDRSRDIIGSARDQFFRTSPGLTNTINAGGATNQSQAALQQFLSVLQGGGRTAQTNQLFDLGTGLVQGGGLTPELSQLMGLFQSQVQGGGMTPEMQQVFQALLPIIQAGGAGGAVLPDEVAASFAQDAATTANRSAQESLRRQAFQRGGGPGTVVDSGLENQFLAEGQDEMVRLQAQALREAVMGQQTARLQQLGIATQGAGGVLGNAASVLGSANAGLGDVSRALASNLSTGANLATSAEQLVNQLFGTAGTGFTNTFGAETQRLGTAAGALSQQQDALRQAETLGTGLGLDVGRSRTDNLRLVQQLFDSGLGQMLGLSNQKLEGLKLALGSELGGLSQAANVANQGSQNAAEAARTLFGGGIDLFGQLANLGNTRAGVLAPNQNIQNPPTFLERLATLGQTPGLDKVFGQFRKPKGDMGNV